MKEKGIGWRKYFTLKESLQSSLFMWIFIFGLFGGIVIAPTAWITRLMIECYKQYYNWLFDYLDKND